MSIVPRRTRKKFPVDNGNGLSYCKRVPVIQSFSSILTMPANLTPETESREGTSVLHITATDARLRLGEMIDAALSGDRVVIHRHGKRIAALVGLRELEALESAA